MLYLLICCLLSACAVGTSGTSVQPNGGEPPALSHAQLRRTLAALPGAQVPETEPLRVLFPAGSLFARGSVLPMPGGTGLLDGLADLLKKSQLPWQLTLRATSGEGTEYDKGLAASRVEVLKTYFKDVGLNPRKLRFKSAAEEGALLEMQLLK